MTSEDEIYFVQSIVFIYDTYPLCAVDKRLLDSRRLKDIVGSHLGGVNKLNENVNK
jgi:hypothetical protein